MMRHVRLRPLPHDTGGIRCMPNAAADKPEVTPGMVLSALRRIPLPSVRTYAQPAGTTLVNLDTILHTRAADLTRTVRILGQRVRLKIHPATFVWTHGDGTTQTTSGPGNPYPARTIVHRYLHAHTTVRLRVAVIWTATYTVNGGPSGPVPGTVTTSGSETTLHIAEAVPALSGAAH